MAYQTCNFQQYARPWQTDSLTHKDNQHQIKRYAKMKIRYSKNWEETARRLTRWRHYRLAFILASHDVTSQITTETSIKCCPLADITKLDGNAESDCLSWRERFVPSPSHSSSSSSPHLTVEDRRNKVFDETLTWRNVTRLTNDAVWCVIVCARFIDVGFLFQTILFQ